MPLKLVKVWKHRTMQQQVFVTFKAWRVPKDLLIQAPALVSGLEKTPADFVRGCVGPFVLQ